MRSALQDIGKRDVVAVDLLRQFLVLLELRAVQRRADEGAFAARVSQDASLVSRVSRSRASNGTGRSRDVGAKFYVTFHQPLHAFIVHDEHHQVRALAADLWAPTHA